MDELQEYLKINMPIFGEKIKNRYNSRIVIKEDMKKNLIYLNNYLNISSESLYFMTDKEYDDLLDKNCNTCSNNDRVFGCTKCFIDDGNKLCSNFTEVVSNSLWKWFKDKNNKL
ncbi:DUF3939 domain-containing protein [Paenibacillus pini]|uniref:Uncharacterized protein n=1 Tax=Paenibacillus pini JCM 16418 TaxID=1236976 RepID=W7Z141_9BACL|nr:DUF3939 domain-containing protein [Paenibacillus pini]GAF10711.1 hypothetical protein JCM16418_4930 [Paenibacillus pini JCM 16418]